MEKVRQRKDKKKYLKKNLIGVGFNVLGWQLSPPSFLKSGTVPVLAVVLPVRGGV